MFSGSNLRQRWRSEYVREEKNKKWTTTQLQNGDESCREPESRKSSDDRLVQCLFIVLMVLMVFHISFEMLFLMMKRLMKRLIVIAHSTTKFHSVSTNKGTNQTSARCKKQLTSEEEPTLFPILMKNDTLAAQSSPSFNHCWVSSVCTIRDTVVQWDGLRRHMTVPQHESGFFFFCFFSWCKIIMRGSAVTLNLRLTHGAVQRSRRFGTCRPSSQPSAAAAAAAAWRWRIPTSEAATLGQTVCLSVSPSHPLPRKGTERTIVSGGPFQKTSWKTRVSSSFGDVLPCCSLQMM